MFPDVCNPTMPIFFPHSSIIFAQIVRGERGEHQSVATRDSSMNQAVEPARHTDPLNTQGGPSLGARTPASWPEEGMRALGLLLVLVIRCPIGSKSGPCQGCDVTLPSLAFAIGPQSPFEGPTSRNALALFVLCNCFFSHIPQIYRFECPSLQGVPSLRPHAPVRNPPPAVHTVHTTQYHVPHLIFFF